MYRDDFEDPPTSSSTDSLDSYFQPAPSVTTAAVMRRPESGGRSRPESAARSRPQSAKKSPSQTSLLAQQQQLGSVSGAPSLQQPRYEAQSSTHHVVGVDDPAMSKRAAEDRELGIEEDLSTTTSAKKKKKKRAVTTRKQQRSHTGVGSATAAPSGAVAPRMGVQQPAPQGKPRLGPQTYVPRPSSSGGQHPIRGASVPSSSSAASTSASDAASSSSDVSSSEQSVENSWVKAHAYIRGHQSTSSERRVTVLSEPEVMTTPTEDVMVARTGATHSPQPELPVAVLPVANVPNSMPPAVTSTGHAPNGDGGGGSPYDDDGFIVEDDEPSAPSADDHTTGASVPVPAATYLPPPRSVSPRPPSSPIPSQEELIRRIREASNKCGSAASLALPAAHDSGPSATQPSPSHRMQPPSVSPTTSSSASSSTDGMSPLAAASRPQQNEKATAYEDETVYDEGDFEAVSEPSEHGVLRPGTATAAPLMQPSVPQASTSEGATTEPDGPGDDLHPRSTEVSAAPLRRDAGEPDTGLRPDAARGNEVCPAGSGSQTAYESDAFEDPSTPTDSATQPPRGTASEEVGPVVYRETPTKALPYEPDAAAMTTSRHAAHQRSASPTEYEGDAFETTTPTDDTTPLTALQINHQTTTIADEAITAQRVAEEAAAAQRQADEAAAAQRAADEAAAAQRQADEAAAAQRAVEEAAAQLAADAQRVVTSNPSGSPTGYESDTFEESTPTDDTTERASTTQPQPIMTIAVASATQDVSAARRATEYPTVSTEAQRVVRGVAHRAVDASVGYGTVRTDAQRTDATQRRDDASSSPEVALSPFSEASIEPTSGDSAVVPPSSSAPVEAPPGLHWKVLVPLERDEAAARRKAVGGLEARSRRDLEERIRAALQRVSKRWQHEQDIKRREERAAKEAAEAAARQRAEAAKQQAEAATGEAARRAAIQRLRNGNASSKVARSGGDSVGDAPIYVPRATATVRRGMSESAVDDLTTEPLEGDHRIHDEGPSVVDPDTLSHTWMPLRPSTRALVPDARQQHQSVLFNGNVFVIGGRMQFQPHSLSVAAFHPDSRRLKRLTTTGGGGSASSSSDALPVVGHTASLYQQFAVLVGGVDGSEVLTGRRRDDPYAQQLLSLESLQWTAVPSAETLGRFSTSAGAPGAAPRGEAHHHRRHPNATMFHSAVCLGRKQHALYVFGGLKPASGGSGPDDQDAALEGSSQPAAVPMRPTNTLDVLHLPSLRWENGDDVLRGQMLPPPRHSHSAVAIPDGDVGGASMGQEGDATSATEMLIFGGRAATGDAMNDLWCFSTETRLFAPLRTTGESPSPRYGHAAAVVSRSASGGGGMSRMLVHGGFDSTRTALTSLHMLCVDSLLWTEIAPYASVHRGIGQPPTTVQHDEPPTSRGRAYHTMTTLSVSPPSAARSEDAANDGASAAGLVKLLLFGGASNPTTVAVDDGEATCDAALPINDETIGSLAALAPTVTLASLGVLSVTTRGAVHARQLARRRAQSSLHPHRPADDADARNARLVEFASVAEEARFQRTRLQKREEHAPIGGLFSATSSHTSQTANAHAAVVVRSQAEIERISTRLYSQPSRTNAKLAHALEHATTVQSRPHSAGGGGGGRKTPAEHDAAMAAMYRRQVEQQQKTRQALAKQQRANRPPRTCLSYAELQAFCARQRRSGEAYNNRTERLRKTVSELRRPRTASPTGGDDHGSSPERQRFATHADESSSVQRLFHHKDCYCAGRGSGEKCLGEQSRLTYFERQRSAGAGGTSSPARSLTRNEVAQMVDAFYSGKTRDRSP